MIKIYNRKEKKYYQEQQYGEKKLSFLYNNTIGRIILKVVISSPFSTFYTLYKKSSLSKRNIPNFIKKYNIKIDDFKNEEYKSFNDFFLRHIKEDKRPISQNIKDFISPCDGKLLVYKITNNKTITIKGSTYTLKELVNDKVNLTDYQNGLCLIFRLSMDDYHRYCYIDSGKLLKNEKIKGKLHTVSSISKDYKIYKENTREFSILKTDNFGELIYMEVGALLVGKIKNHHKNEFLKGEEKGYFDLGGSTIVLLIKEKSISIDEDILTASSKNIETKVEYREKIGVKIC